MNGQFADYNYLKYLNIQIQGYSSTTIIKLHLFIKEQVLTKEGYAHTDKITYISMNIQLPMGIRVGENGFYLTYLHPLLN